MAKKSPVIEFTKTQDFLPSVSPEPTVPFFVIISGKGPVDEQLVDLAGFESLFGKPNILKYGITSLYPYLFLSNTGGVAYVRRALHVEDLQVSNLSTYSGVLSRWFVTGDTDPVMLPLSSGVKIGATESFSFPMSSDTRAIFDASASILSEAVTSSTTFKVTNADTLLDNASYVAVLNAGVVPTGSTTLSKVLSTVYTPGLADHIALSTPLTTAATTDLVVREVYTELGVDKLRAILSPTTGLAVKVVVESAIGSADVIVDDNDNLLADMRVAFVLPGAALAVSYTGEIYTINSKFVVDISYTLVTVDVAVTGTLTSVVHVKVNSSLMQKDAFLALALTPGIHGNNLAIKIESKTNDLFALSVAENGVIVEGPYTCSRYKDSVNSFDKSQYIEDVINGTSRYIWIVDNDDAVDVLTGLPTKPLATNKMYLSPDPVANYLEMSTLSQEQIYSGDSVLSVKGTLSADITAWSVADELVLTLPTGLTAIYTIQSIAIDTLDTTKAKFTIVGIFNENHLSGISVRKLNGFTTAADLSISGNDITVDIGDTFTYLGLSNTVLDAGSNWFKSGQDGLINSADFIAGYENIVNLNKFPQELLISDSGYIDKSVYSAISSLATARARCQFYGGTPMLPLTTLQSEFTNQNIAYAQSTLTDTEFSSIFAGNSKVPYGATTPWVNDSIFTIINQYNNTLVQEGVLPAANLLGILDGIIAKDMELREEYESLLESNQINYARKVASGYRNMSDTTRFSTDSFFQYRHITHYVNAVHSVVESVFQPYLQTVVTEADVDNVKTALQNLVTRNLAKMTKSLEMSSSFLSNGNGTNTWKFKLTVQPLDITTKIVFNLTITNKNLTIVVEQA
jgi:hypothetical protein